MQPALGQICASVLATGGSALRSGISPSLQATVIACTASASQRPSRALRSFVGWTLETQLSQTSIRSPASSAVLTWSKASDPKKPLRPTRSWTAAGIRVILAKNWADDPQLLEMLHLRMTNLQNRLPDFWLVIG